MNWWTIVVTCSAAGTSQLRGQKYKYYVCREHYECQLTFLILNSTTLGACFNLQERQGREGRWYIHGYTSTIYSMFFFFLMQSRRCSCRTNLIVPLTSFSVFQLWSFKTNCKSILSLNFLFFFSPFFLTSLIVFLILSTSKFLLQKWI